MGDPARRPTIIDVAARAGVSKSLVSLAMRGDPRVAESSRLRIEEAVRELGYRTNWAARSLSTLRSGTVGVLVADLHNPWFVEIVDPLRDGAALRRPRHPPEQRGHARAAGRRAGPP